MDLEVFKKYSIPEDEADELARVIRKTIKTFKYKLQDEEEKQKKIIEIKNKIKQELEEGDTFQPLTPLRPLRGLEEDAVPLAIEDKPGPSADDPSTIDINYDFSDEDLKFFKNKGLTLPIEVFNKSKTDENIFSKARKKSIEVSNELRGKVNSLNNKIEKSKQRGKVKKLKEQLDDIDDQIESNKKYRERLDLLMKAKKMVVKKQKGMGTLSPASLLDRLELLYGSIVAGNNSSKVKNEFSEIVHVLRRSGFLNNAQVIKLLSSAVARRG